MNKSNQGVVAPQIITRACYQLAWRWHCYAGLFVIPFLLMLSVTGTVMLYDEQIQNSRYPVLKTVLAEQSGMLPASVQLAALKVSYPQAQVKKYLPPKAVSAASFFVVKLEGRTLHVAINPYTAEVLTQLERNDSWYALANDIHGSLMLGEWGDRAIEVATGFIVLLLISGIYLWLPSSSPAKPMVFVPRIHRGKRTFFRDLHSSLGLYSVVFLLFFVLSGLSWSGVWGAKMVQAWNSFPAEKWDAVPLSNETHSSMNQGVMEEVPWNLEQTKLPESRELISGKFLSIDQLTALAEQLGMMNYQLNLPSSASGVYTLSADTMSGDVADPRLDRTVHIDQYTGDILVDIGFAEYSLLAKVMAAGVGLHQGGLGWINLALNTVLCLIFILISVSGIWLWWTRRPEKSLGINAPAIKVAVRWKSAMLLVLLLGLLFPLTGIALLVVLFVDSLVQLLSALYQRYRVTLS